MIAEINQGWNWKGFVATEILQTNDFGNVIFKSESGDFWRICPEEVTCKIIAKNESELKKVLSDSEFIEDWEMSNIIKIAKLAVGELAGDEKYCLKVPALVGGEYENANFGKVSFKELILFSGNLAKQTQNLKDGAKVKFVFKK